MSKFTKLIKHPINFFKDMTYNQKNLKRTKYVELRHFNRNKYNRLKYFKNCACNRFYLYIKYKMLNFICTNVFITL